MKLCLKEIKRSLYHFSQLSSSSSYSSSASYSVADIVKNQKNNPSFVYSHTKQVCRTITTLFEGIAQNEKQNIHQLRTLMRNVHLSSFRSWKQLRQTSSSIQKVLNEKIIQRKTTLSRIQLNILCLILHSINYELEIQSDSSFIKSQILSSVDFQGLKFNFQDLHMMHAFSCHSELFEKLLAQRKDLEEILTRLLDQSLNNQSDEMLSMLLTNIVKNGLYQTRWNSQFLAYLTKILTEQQSLDKEYKSLLNAIKLHVYDPNSKEQKLWHVTQTAPDKETSNVITETKIISILKELDYNVQINQCLFNYEVDFKIGKDCIVEYHGIHHYKTNTNAPIQTRKSDWKTQCFKKRGYKTCIIPFYKWNLLQNSYRKKAWLIEHMENKLFFSGSS